MHNKHIYMQPVGHDRSRMLGDTNFTSGRVPCIICNILYFMHYEINRQLVHYQNFL